MPGSIRIYCDESTSAGRYFSNFYGAAIVEERNVVEVEAALKACKTEQNVFGEAKWNKVTAAYLEKYKAIVDVIFDLVSNGKIRLRVMFTQNAESPTGLTREQVEDEFFILYYYLIKEGLGLREAPASTEDVPVTLLLDELPRNTEQKARFRSFLIGLNHNRAIRRGGFHFAPERIGEAKSHGMKFYRR